MAISALAATGIGLGGALLGGIAGAQGQQATQRRTIGPESGLSKYIRNDIFQPQLGQLESFADVFGLQDVQAGRQGQLDLAQMLQGLSESGGLPTAQDIQTARGSASNLLAGERASLQNSLSRAQEQSNRQAVQMGRSTNDPILQAQLRRQGIEAEREIAGRETALTQQIGSSLPFQRLQFQQQRAGVLQGIGSQASTMRSNLLNLGTNIQNMENAIRLGQQTTSFSQGGGMQGALTGALGGAGAGLGLLGGINALGGSPSYNAYGSTMGGKTSGALFYENMVP